MRLPNKVTFYSNSVIAYFPDILEVLKLQDMSPKDLLDQLTIGKKDMSDFLSALDCLFALGKLELVEEGRLLRYVGSNSM